MLLSIAAKNDVPPINAHGESGILHTVRVAVFSLTAAKNDVAALTLPANPNDPPCAGSTDSCLIDWPCLVNSTISLG